MALKTAENIKKVSLILFIVLGLGQILSGFMMTNNIGLPYTYITNRVLNIPFAIVALIYGLSSIKTGLKEGDHKIINVLMIIFTLLIFVGLVYINIFIPDKITTL